MDQCFQDQCLPQWFVFTGTAEDACELVRELAEQNAARLMQKQLALYLKRHGVSGCPYVSKPPATRFGKGGEGRSLAGRDCEEHERHPERHPDGKRTDLSFIHMAHEAKFKLAEAAEQGAAQLLTQLKKLPGGGGLISKRVMTYLEARCAGVGGWVWAGEGARD